MNVRGPTTIRASPGWPALQLMRLAVEGRVPFEGGRRGGGVLPGLRKATGEGSDPHSGAENGELLAVTRIVMPV